MRVIFISAFWCLLLVDFWQSANFLQKELGSFIHISYRGANHDRLTDRDLFHIQKCF